MPFGSGKPHIRLTFTTILCTFSANSKILINSLNEMSYGLSRQVKKLKMDRIGTLVFRFEFQGHITLSYRGSRICGFLSEKYGLRQSAAL